MILLLQKHPLDMLEFLLSSSSINMLEEEFVRKGLIELITLITMFRQTVFICGVLQPFLGLINMIP